MTISKKHIAIFLGAMIIGFILYFIIKLYKNRAEAGYYRDNFLCLNIPPNLPGVGCQPGQLFDLNHPAVSSYCVDCGPGGMFGPGWTMEKFQKQTGDMKRRAAELSGGLQGADLDRAVQNAGGLIPYIKGREIALNHKAQAIADLNPLINIGGVNGFGDVNDGIEISVLDQATKQKVQQFISNKNKKYIPNPPGTYAGYPVTIVIQPMAVAQ